MLVVTTLARMEVSALLHRGLAVAPHACRDDCARRASSELAPPAPCRCSDHHELHRCWARAHGTRPRLPRRCVLSRRADGEVAQSRNLAQNRRGPPSDSRNFALDAWVFGAIIESKHRCASLAHYDRQRRTTSGFWRIRASAAAVGTSFATQPRAHVGRLRLVPEPDRARQLSAVAASRQGVGDGVRPRAQAALHDARVHGRARTSAAAPSVEQAIQLDPRLEAAQKEALIRIYRSFVGKG